MRTIIKKVRQYYPQNRYATFPCNGEYTNINFDELLIEIGKYCFESPYGNLNDICRQISIQINKDWKLNKWRRRDCKVSISQVKSIRKSFHKAFTDHDYVIKLPFDVVPIFYYIMCLAQSIENENSKISTIIKNMNDMYISDYLYNYHKSIFTREYRSRIGRISNEELLEKYHKLYANLTQKECFFNDTFSNISKYDPNDYKLR